MLQNKYEKYLISDIQPLILNLFIDSIKGKYTTEDKTRWISREDFFSLKDTDPFVKYLYSFGNDGDTYMYSMEIEPYKKALHHAICFNDFTIDYPLKDIIDLSLIKDIKGTIHERRIAMRHIVKEQIRMKMNLMKKRWPLLCERTRKQKHRTIAES